MPYGVLSADKAFVLLQHCRVRTNNRNQLLPKTQDMRHGQKLLQKKAGLNPSKSEFNSHGDQFNYLIIKI
jgi:hypothetical protein